MTPLRITAALILGLSLTACDEEQGRNEPAGFDGSGGGKADDADGAELDPEIQMTHLAAVGACEAAARRDRENTSELRYLERTEIEEDRLRCISDANDGVRSALAATLQITAPELASDVDNAFNEWRTEHGRLCDALVEAHELALEKSISAVQVGCAAEAELRLAEAVEAFADLGGTRAAAPDIATRYETCHQLYETAVEDLDLGPDGSSEDPAVVEAAREQAEADAQEVLADCIEDELAEAIPVLSDRVVDSYPGREEGQVNDAFERTLDNGSEGIGQVCDVLGYSTPDGGPVRIQECRTAAASWRHELMGYIVPEVGPETEEPAPEEPEGE